MGRGRAPGARGPRPGPARPSRPGPGWAAPRDKNPRHTQPQGRGVAGAAGDTGPWGAEAAGREGREGARGHRGARPPERRATGAWGARP
jgi:hypothetical protein